MKIFYYNCFGWIMTIAKRTLFSMNRKYNKVQSLNILEDIPDNENSEMDIQNLSVKFELGKLDQSHRSILLLNIYYGLNYKEISKILGVSVSTIKRKKEEISQLLKEKLADEKY